MCLAQGTLFHDRMEPEILESVRKELLEFEEKYLAEHPGAVIERVPQP